jgi:hypothetical protein
MSLTKELFSEMREVGYSADFSKKQAQITGKQLAERIADEGNVSKHEALANLVRLSEVVNTAISELKERVSDEKVTVMGVEFTPINGRKMPQYKDDELYRQIANELEQRKNLLDAALKSDQPIYDSEGVEVPKVSVNFSKSSLTIKF